jgi:hypothetical protein
MSNLVEWRKMWGSLSSDHHNYHLLGCDVMQPSKKFNISADVFYSTLLQMGRFRPQSVVPHPRKHRSWSCSASGFGGLGVACCLWVPKFAGSNPAEAVRIFRGEKILSTPSYGGEVKLLVPCRRVRQNYRPTSSPSSSFHCWDLLRRMDVGSRNA